jgi:4-hydroxy-tetrahydrodipicolinate reductase
MSQTNKKLNVVVIGQGKLAQAILSVLPQLDQNKGYINSVQTYDGQPHFFEPAIMVHVGSGRQYHECLALALKERCVFIQAATAKDIPLPPPVAGDIVYIHAPNLDLRLIKLFHWLKLGAALFQEDEKTLTESHQATKTSVPGTAYKICDILGLDRANVQSIRDPDQQRDLQIHTLEQHAFHQLIIGNRDSSIKIETKVEGNASYVQGLYALLQSVMNIPAGNYEVEELLVQGYYRNKEHDAG